MEDPLNMRLPLIALLLAAAAPCAAPTRASTPSDSSSAAPVPVVLAPPTPPDFPRGKISGYMFGDAYYNLTGDPRHLYDTKGVDQGQANIDGKKNIGKD